MIVAAASLNQTPIDWSGNLNRIEKAVNLAKENGAKLLICPELSLCGYGCDDYFFMPWLYDMCLEQLEKRLEPLSNGMFLAVGMPFQFENNRYNGLAVCIDGKWAGIYLKQILPHTGVYYEPRWFQPWPQNKQAIFEWKGRQIPVGDFTLTYEGIKIGFEICEDAWHTDKRPACYGAARMAYLVLNASASNYARGKKRERHAIIHDLKDRYRGAYLYSNALGNESGRLLFDGEILFARNGELEYASDRFSFEEVVVECFDISQPESDHPFAKQKADFENEFVEVARATTLGLWDYLRKSKSKGFALSLSGGADSAACAVLVAEMLKRVSQLKSKSEIEAILGITFPSEDPQTWLSQILHCVYQQSKNSGEVTQQAARSLCNEIECAYDVWSIDAAVAHYTAQIEKTIGRPLTWEQDDVSLQNIQARVRAPGIWMLANLKNLLLITTSNRSEGDVGYCTMDGDTAGSLAPIAGLSKHFIRQWLRWAEKDLGYKSLAAINTQAPTAELRPPSKGQTDEADLMPYDLLEAIETLFLQEKINISDIPAVLAKSRTEPLSYLEQQTQRFFTLWTRSQWKRERLAPSFHLDRFNIDPKSGGRFPILSGS